MSAENEQQLLEDASTLLMFANAAARQQSPGPTAPPKSHTQSPENTPNPQPTHSENQSEPSTTSLSHSVTISDPSETKGPYAVHGHGAQTSHLPTISSKSSANVYSGSASPQAPQGPQGPNGTNQTHATNQLKPNAQNVRPSHSHPNSQNHPTPEPTPYYNSQYPPYLPSALGPPLGNTLRNSKSQGDSPTNESQQLASAPVVGSYKFPPERQRLVPLSPKPPSTSSGPANVAQNLNLSPRFSALPVQGSFRNSHKKAHSDGTQLKTKAATTPALAISRGINVESGQRRNDNAVIAAAALAAAADNPLPMLKSGSSAGSDASTPNKESGFKASPKVKLLSEPSALKTDESIATEPEDDNKTEDELPPKSTVDRLVKIEGNPNMVVASAIQPPSKPQEEVLNPVSDTVQVNMQAEDAKANQKQAQIPPLESYKVDPDAGTIGCICGIEEDDGFTIQCDLCFRWQHCSCMGYVSSEEVPEDEYKCYFCDELKWNKFDPKKCRMATIKRLELDKVNEEPPEKAPAPKRKTSSSGNEDKKRRKSEKDARSVTERPTSEKRKSSSGASPKVNSVAAFEVNNINNPLLEDGVTAEAYQNVYYRLSDYDYKTPDVKSALQLLAETMDTSKTESLSAAQLKQVKFSKVILPNHLKYLQDRNEFQKNKASTKTTIKVKAYSENPKQKFVGVSKIGLFISESSVHTAGEVVIPSGTNVIEYLGEVDKWEHHASNKVNQFPLWGTVKPRVAKVDIPLKDNGFVSVVLDARFVGNEARFIRKSCSSTANCEIKPLYIPHLKKFKFHVVTTRPIVLKSSSTDEELRIAWEWDQNHPIRQMLKANSDGIFEEGKKFEDFSEEDRATLVSCVDTILNFVECGCNTSNSNHQCSIFKVKKATSYLLRSTRKLSSLTNSSNTKSREELVMPKKSKQYVSWKERLIERDNLLQASLLGAEEEESKAGEAPETTEKIEKEDGSEFKEKFHIPFRKQLLAKKQAPLKKYNIAEDVSVELNTSRSPTNTIQRSVAIPLTHKILKTIKEKINDAFEPLENAGKNAVTDVQSSAIIAKEIKTESPVVAVAADAEEAPKPPVKKKLSFADYKKKMK